MLDFESRYFRHDGVPIRTYLVHRLKRPFDFSPSLSPEAVVGDKTFAIGKTAKERDRPTQETWGIIRQLFSFDYMGSVEFEWGAAPYALVSMNKERKDYHLLEVVLDAAKIKSDRVYAQEQIKRAPPLSHIHVLCRRDHDDYARTFIERLAYESRAAEHLLKERIYFAENLLYKDRSASSQILAWLDLSNGIFWSYCKDLTMAVAKFICQV